MISSWPERPSGVGQLTNARRWFAARRVSRNQMPLAEAGNTTHELMAISGHKTLTEVQRYTDDADRKRLAESGMAKRKGQSVNTELSNPAVESVKPTAKPLK